jgi:hypothetical protein
MKKVLFGAVLIVASATMVSAQERPQTTRSTGPTHQPSTRQGTARPNEHAAGTQGMHTDRATSTRMGSTSPMMPHGTSTRPMISTGDATKDAQVEALVREMETKIKAIRDEYEPKIRAIVGDSRPMMGSSTRLMGDRGDRMYGDRANNATSTPRGGEGDRHEGRPGTNGDRPVFPPRRGDQGPAATSTPVSLLKNYFQSFFGGAPADAQAGENQ